MLNKYAFSLGESSYSSSDDGKGCIKIRNRDDLSALSQPISFYYIDNKTKLQLGDALLKPPTINSKELEINLETEINNNLDISGNVSILGDNTLDNSSNCILYVNGGVTQENISKNIFLQAQKAYSNNIGGNIYLYAGKGVVDGIIEISGNIIPSQSNKYDLGSSSRLFRDIYLSENSLWLGDEISLSISTSSEGIKEAGFRKRKKEEGQFIIPSNAIGYGKTADELRQLSISELTDFMRTNTGFDNPWEQELFENFNNFNFVWEKDENSNIFVNEGTNVGINKQDPEYTLDISGTLAVNSMIIDTNTLVVNNNKIGILTNNPTTDLDIFGSVNIEQDATIKGSLYLNNPIITSFEIITSNGIIDNTKSTSFIELINIQVDISMNDGINGSTKHILYDDDSLDTTYANVNFSNNGLVTGGGYYSKLKFTNRGQSATLIFISGKWRIINTGASVF